MPTTLVTGGAGFIGSHLVQHLLFNGHRVIVLDDLSMGRAENLPRSPRLRFVYGSITNTPLLAALLTSERPDYIYHLAAIASVAHSIAAPAACHLVNYSAVVHLLQLIRDEQLPLRKLVFASSAAVYGSAPALPKTEDLPVSPESPYAIDKYASERMVLAFGALHDIPTVAARFFNVYGPRQNPRSPYSGVLSKLTAALQTGQPFTCLGDGEQTRDFVYVADVVAALVRLGEDPAVTNAVFNVGTGQASSLNDVIRLLETISRRRLRRRQAAARPGDIKHSRASSDRLQALGWRPQYALPAGLSAYWTALAATP
ncbi:NAD-dependent epimerase/dehydratase family protein [Schleiferilactobacillus shenzhenensis]|uniref:GalE n=1 Tax=Schleiferilactobacillus shenzhenensis LY-73 TaxID=1231336 RepID=U4TLT2_9LACO|nr:NAD-dependent epimerase/dehydratase family protein [Schleiferilactobacillus shenzhenensis]ERL65811.1 GalE [Schleiferilactobacillus shenzhenensis LY-73]